MGRVMGHVMGHVLGLASMTRAPGALRPNTIVPAGRAGRPVERNFTIHKVFVGAERRNLEAKTLVEGAAKAGPARSGVLGSRVGPSSVERPRHQSLKTPAGVERSGSPAMMSRCRSGEALATSGSGGGV
jgi:hypothetical protein